MKPTLDWIKGQREQMITLLEQWANINSGSENLAGLAVMLTALQKEFVKLDGEIKSIAVPSSIRIDSRGHAVEVIHGHALRIKKHPKAHIQILLGGHMDTVYSSTSHFQHTTRIDNNKMQGPGVADMKGGLIVMLTALEALERSDLAGKIGWEVLITADEELGSTGSEELIAQSARHHAIGLLFEPAFPDGAVVSARKGSANFTVVAKGKAAHAGRDFHEGRNAITAIARFIAQSETLNDKEKGITLNIGHIEGGGPINIVPDLAICRFNVRMVGPKDLNRIRDKLDRMVKEQIQDGVTMTLYEHTTRPPKPYDHKNQALFAALYACAAELGITLQHKASGGVCDGNILSAEGLPTIDTLGVVGGNIHTPEEYVILDSLVERAQLTAYFLLKLANRELDIIDLKERPS